MSLLVKGMLTDTFRGPAHGMSHDFAPVVGGIELDQPSI